MYFIDSIFIIIINRTSTRDGSVLISNGTDLIDLIIIDIIERIRIIMISK